MARAKRMKLANMAYIISTYGLSELKLFRDIVDKAKFIELIEKNSVIYHVEVYSYTFTENSVEIMLYDSKGNLSEFMKCVKGTYCQHYYNEKYNRKGTIYKDRFKSRIVYNFIYNNYSRKINKKLLINDGNFINFNLDEETVFSMIKKYFKFDVSKDLSSRFFRNSEGNLEIISILIFSLRSFCGYIHKNIAKLLRGVSETMSSTLSLNGVELIKKKKYREFYFKLLMIIYSDERNCVEV